MMQLTRQGVRDLNTIPVPKRERRVLPPDCDHRAMRECCPSKPGQKGCGHYSCRCGIFWDHYYEGRFG